MSGYEQIRAASEAEKAERHEYKTACVKYLCEFCEEFTSQFLGVECGRDQRVGNENLSKSDKDVAYVQPPYFDEESGSVYTILRVESHRVEIAVRRLGGTFYIETLEKEFEGSIRSDAFTHIKDWIIENMENSSRWKR